MSVKTEIQNKLKSEVSGVSKRLNRPIKELAPADEVEAIIYRDCQILVERIRTNLSGIVKSQRMVKSIEAFKGKANYSVTIGPNYNYYNYFVLRFIEFGTAERFRRFSKRGSNKKTAKNVSAGVIPARPFMRPAYESLKDQLFKNIQKNIIKSIELKLR